MPGNGGAAARGENGEPEKAKPRRSLPAVQAAKLRETRWRVWSERPIFSHLRSLSAGHAARPRETAETQYDGYSMKQFGQE
jgi:hypothetical protein